MEKYWGEDPRAVVIDELFGTWVAALAAVYVDGPAYISISLATIGFVLFRVIDITKPLGCRWISRNIHGGWGCMLDDALAGFYAFIVTLIIRYFHLVEYLHGAFYFVKRVVTTGIIGAIAGDSFGGCVSIHPVKHGDFDIYKRTRFTDHMVMTLVVAK